jgi:hypothetical protein
VQFAQASFDEMFDEDVALPNEESSILEEIQRYRKNDNTIDLCTKFVHDPRPTWNPPLDLFERHPRAVNNFMREVGLDLQDDLPEVALSGSEESINTLEDEENNDTDDTDEDGDISQENEFQNPQPHTNIQTETFSTTPFPARHSTRLRNPPVRLAYGAHADTSLNYTWTPPDLIMEMQHAYTTEVDNAMDFNTTDPHQFLPAPDNRNQAMKLPPRPKKFWIASFV